jgi:hypothetical protein
MRGKVTPYTHVHWVFCFLHTFDPLHEGEVEPCLGRVQREDVTRFRDFFSIGPPSTCI